MLHPRNKVVGPILSTLAYFDIFDFPLTEEEIEKFLHTSQKIPHDLVKRGLSGLNAKKVANSVYYFLPKREHIITKRILRQKISEQKIEEALPFIRLLGYIPTVAFIGISGSLAMENGDEDSDIDLFVISFPHTLWFTRLLLWLALSLLLKRRYRQGSGKDLLCLNLLMDRDHLPLAPKRQDIYTAHEILQLVPIVNKYQTYELFLEKNAWLKKYLANGFIKKQYKEKIPYRLAIFITVLLAFEKTSMWLQLLYMKKHKTIEETTSQFIAFHPYNYRDTITKEYQKKLKAYGI